MAESTAYSRRGVIGGAKPSTVVGDLNNSTTTIPGADLSTWAGASANGPITWTINRGKADEESGEATAVSGNNLTGCTRGLFGTTAQEHDAGATLELTSSKRDFDEANYAVAETVGKITAANEVLVGDGANSLTPVSVAASRIFARLASGDLKGCTVAEIKTLLAYGTAAAADLVDEDDMASDSAVAVPSQQSVKAYVDASSSGTSGVLAVKQYSPGSDTTISTTSTTLTAADTTNLRTPAFTVPASGAVVVVVSVAAGPTTTSHNQYVGLMVAGSQVGKQETTWRTAAFKRFSFVFTVSGLTPAASIQIDLAHRIENASTTSQLFAGPDSGNFGAAEMVVLSA